MKVVIIQCPLVQLNSPYPSGAYLYSFFNKLKNEEDNLNISSVNWYDFSIKLFHKIFCHDGLQFLFEATEKKALLLAEEAEKKGDNNSAFNLRRYISSKENWINWIDNIVEMLCDGQSVSTKSKYSVIEYSHSFIFSADSPRGSRMDNYLETLDHEITSDDSKMLASLALADLADYINFVFDNNFSLIKYAGSLAESQSSFDKIIDSINSPVLTSFYKELLNTELEKIKHDYINNGDNSKILFCLTVPFPGVLSSALFTSKVIKSYFGDNAIIALGGGYVNTELRNLTEKRIFDYIDLLVYDRGYGAFKLLLNNINLLLQNEKLYSIKHYYNNSIIEEAEENSEQYFLGLDLDNKYTKIIFPDYSDIDFSNYIRARDSTNPMHSLWSNGSWIKAYLAQGCYWHRCAFCDTSLDYVKNYVMVNVKNLYEHLLVQAKEKRVFGIHFVDEASPPVSLKHFALLNIKNKNLLNFWGNIRFEKYFNNDIASILGKGGLVAVSGGIEIATQNGLSNINKGTSIKDVVFSCAAFREAGILVHAYMIFGFYNETPEMLIDSMETLRQLFNEGLINSAFWHKFVLTKHSTIYREWKNNKNSHKLLTPIIDNKKRFAENDLHFLGEEKSQKYSEALDFALENWSHGQMLDKAVQSFFNFKMPQPSIKKNYIKSIIKEYENEQNLIFDDYERYCKNTKNYYWIGGKCLEKENTICWMYHGEMFEAEISKNEKQNISDICNYINKMTVENSSSKPNNFLLSQNVFKSIRGVGLVYLSGK